MTVPTTNRHETQSSRSGHESQVQFAQAPVSNPNSSRALGKLLETTGGKFLAATVGIGSLAVAGALGFAMKGGDNAPTDPEHAHITLENSTPDQFWSPMFTDAERVQYANKLLQQQSNDPEYPGMTVEKAAYLRLQKKLGAVERSPLKEWVPPSIDNTANEALIQQQTVTAAAIYVADSNMGEKILAADADDSNPGLESERADVREKHQYSEEARLANDFKIGYVPLDGPASEAAGHDVEKVTPVSSEGSPIGNITTEAGVPTRVALVLDNQNSNEMSENVQVFVGGRWISQDVFDSTDVSKWIPPKNMVDIEIK